MTGGLSIPRLGCKTDFISGSPRLAVDHAGAGDLLLMLHGTGGGRSNWHDQLPEFARHVHAAAWDARGYGDSEDYEGPLLYSDLCDDINRVIDHFQVEKVHLLGLSLGGRMAIEFAVRHPDRLYSLILSDSDSGVKSIPREEQEAFMVSRKAPLLAGREIRDIAPGIAEALLGPNATAAMRTRLIESMAGCRKESYLKVIDAYGFDRTDDLPKIDTPTLVVVGACDRITPPATAQSIASAVVGARLAVVPDAGHLSNIENPEAFNRIVLGFLLPLLQSHQ